VLKKKKELKFEKEYESNRRTVKNLHGFFSKRIEESCQGDYQPCSKKGVYWERSSESKGDL